MQIDTTQFQTIREAEYDPATDMLRLIVVCRQIDVPTEVDDGPLIRDLNGISRAIIVDLLKRRRSSGVRDVEVTE